MLRIISPGLFPNTQADDIWLALQELLQWWQWSDDEPLHSLRAWFRDRFYSRKVYLLNAGRSALYLLLKSAGIGAGDEVLVQAFTCIGAVDPILWVGAKPVFVDILPETYNMDPLDLNRKITPRSKLIIVQHTFGIPAEVTEIDRVAGHHDLLLIEDCAHSLGATLEDRPIGTFGDAAFFSFGRDKVISSVFGGAAVIHQPAKFKDIDEIYSQLHLPTTIWTLQQLFHPLAAAAVLPTYRLQLGKILLIAMQRLRLLSKPYCKPEYRGDMPNIYPKKLPSVLAELALNQLRKLNRFNNKRMHIAEQYGRTTPGAIYLRYPLLVENPHDLYRRARSRGIILGRWYSNVIDPAGVDMERLLYPKGSCPTAEETATKIINLPTNPRMSQTDIGRVKAVIERVQK